MASDLAVWRRSRDLAIDVHRISGQGEFRREWGLRDQIRRSALSVPSNIAEGAARGSDRDSVRFFLFARRSLAELAMQADIAAAIGIPGSKQAEAWLSECHELSAMLARLIDARCPAPPWSRRSPSPLPDA